MTLFRSVFASVLQFLPGGINLQEVLRNIRTQKETIDFCSALFKVTLRKSFRKNHRGGKPGVDQQVFVIGGVKVMGHEGMDAVISKGSKQLRSEERRVGKECR